MLKQCSKHQGLKVCVFPRGGGTSADDGGFLLEAQDARGRVLGEAQVERRVLNRAPGMGGRKAMRIADVEVDERSRRGGVGTALYEKALELACAEKAILVSDFHRSRFAEAFWRKQVRQQRASCVKRNPNAKYAANYFVGPMMQIRDAIETDCYENNRTERAQKKCVDERMKAAKAGLPKPPRKKGGSPGDNDYRAHYWPCGLYAIKKNHCGGSLRGVR